MTFIAVYSVLRIYAVTFLFSPYVYFHRLDSNLHHLNVQDHSMCLEHVCWPLLHDIFWRPFQWFTFSFVSIRHCWRQPPICWTLIFTGLCHICVRQSVEGSTQDRTTATSAYSSTKDVRRARKRSSSSGTHTHIICTLWEVSTMPFGITKQNILHTLFFAVLLYCFYKTNVNSVILIKF